ncbi:cobalt ECF transporter T component CbiQ [Streptomyces sp. NPDC101225]|uniref:cobalt ECF transporter T component CbiQ n=1 Tax=Streptomyces sp. NPDC101225 TaxID=3366135 RepID=UPI0037FCA313
MSQITGQDAPLRTPQWLLQGELAMCPCGCIGKRTKGSYLRKTITSGAQLLQQVMFTEDTAARAGLLQRIDPRAKVVGTVMLLVAASLLRTVPALLLLYVATLAVATASALPLGFFVKRVWLFVPIFTGIMVLPATLSVVTHGEVVWTLWHWNGHPEGFTRQGLLGAALVVSRVAVSISLVVLLTLTTPWVRLLAALRGLGVPKMFIMIIGMAYRYIFLLLNGVTEMYQARTARTLGSARHDRSARAFLAASAGALIGRSHQLSEEVHQAMTARGYTGDAKVLHRFTLRPADGLYLAAAVAVSALVVTGERLLVH